MILLGKEKEEEEREGKGEKETERSVSEWLLPLEERKGSIGDGLLRALTG